MTQVCVTVRTLVAKPKRVGYLQRNVTTIVVRTN